MILPIYLYGQPVLRQEAEEITKDYPDLENLVENMYETMYASSDLPHHKLVCQYALSLSTQML